MREAKHMIIKTERLILRPWTEEDAKSLYQYARDERVGPSAGWPPHTSVENSRAVIKAVLSAEDTYAVVLKETGEPVGSASIMRPGRGDAPMTETEAEIGYWIGVPYWGRGLIPEAVRALQKRCFEQLGCTAVWCGYFDGNEKSKRVQEKCGFEYRLSKDNVPCAIEGVTHTVHFTCITREMWER